MCSHATESNPTNMRRYGEIYFRIEWVKDRTEKEPDGKEKLRVRVDAVSCLPRSNRANDRGNGIGYPGGFGHAGDGAQGNRGAAKQAAAVIL